MAVRVKSSVPARLSGNGTISQGTIVLEMTGADSSSAASAASNPLLANAFKKEDFTDAGQVFFSTGPQFGGPYYLTDILAGNVPGFNGISIDDLQKPNADYDMNGHKVINVADPTDPQDAVTVNFADQTYLRLDGGNKYAAQFEFLPGSVTQPSFVFGSDHDTGFYWETEGVVSFASNSVKHLEIGPTLVVSDGDYLHPGIGFLSKPSTGMFLSPTGAIGWTIQSTEVLRVEADNLVSSGTGAFVMPKGNTAERPLVPTEGMIRFNTDKPGYEVWDGITWRDIMISGANDFLPLTGGTLTGDLTISSGSKLYGDEWYFASDTNTGIRFSTVNQIDLVVGTADAAIVDKGRITVKDNLLPTIKLDNSSTSGTAGTIKMVAGGTTYGEINTKIDSSTDSSILFHGQSSGSPSTFAIMNNDLRMKGGYYFMSAPATGMKTGIGGSLVCTVSGSDMITVDVNKAVFGGTEGIVVPQGNTAARGTTDGTLRLNTDTNDLEYLIGGTWYSLLATTGSGSGSSTQYLPLTGGTLTGHLAGPSVSVDAGSPTSPSIAFNGHATTGISHTTSAGIDGISVSVAGNEKFRVTDGSNSEASAKFLTRDAISLPSGTTSERPASPFNGDIRYNSETGRFEGYINGTWRDFDMVAANISGGYEQVLGTATVDLMTTGITTVYTVPGSVNGAIITKVILKVTSANPGASPTPAAVSIGTGNILKDNIVGNTPVTFGGSLTSAGRYAILHPLDGAVMPMGGDQVSINVQTAAGGSMTGLTVDVLVMGFEV